MMANLTQILKSGESETAEFKENFDKETIETVGAFSNTRGGCILIGVKNDSRVIGVNVSIETLKDWSNIISQVSEPTVIPEIREDRINEKRIIVIQIPEYPLKPVAIRGRCFRRVATSNRQMSPQEIAQMHLLSTGNSWDALAARENSLDAIDIEKVEKYIKVSTANGRKKFSPTEGQRQILSKLELIKNESPTWAAILLFGIRPQSPLTQAQVHCGRFKNSVKIIDNRLIEGSIIDQVDDVMDFIRKNINVQFVITGKPQRDEIWDYPLEALREAIINALCHRDYSHNADIQIKIFDDFIQIWSPGPLPYGMTIEELYEPTHSSKPRNKLIAQIFYDLGLIERYGSGIQRMINACFETGLPEPTFEEKFGGFLVTFRKDIFNIDNLNGFNLNERQVKAIMFIKATGKITNKEYQKITGIKDRIASMELNDLVSKSLLDKVGTTGRGTYYILNKAAKGASKTH